MLERFFAKQRVNVVEWVYDDDKNKIYMRTTKNKVPVLYDKTTDSFFVKYKNVKVPIKHNYIKQGSFSVINYENSFIPLDTSEIDIKITDIDVTTTSRRKIIDDEVEKDKPEGSDDEEVDKRKTAKILKMLSMPMDVRSWYLINLKKVAKRGEGFWAKYGHIALVVMFFAFALAVVYVVPDVLGKIAQETAVQVARETTAIVLDKYWEMLSPIIKQSNVTIDLPANVVTTTTTTIPELPLPP